MLKERHNDTLPYDDAFGEEDRKIILLVLEEDMQKRWEKSKQIYEMQGCTAAEFITYDGVEHEITDEIQNDIIQFFKNHI